MLIGAAGPAARDPGTLFRGRFAAEAGARWLGAHPAMAGVAPMGVPSLDAEERTASSRETGAWLAVLGHVYAEEGGTTGPEHAGLASRLLRLLDARGPQALAAIDGTFALAWFEPRARRLYLMRDAFGVEPLYYGETGASVLFGSSTRDLVATGLFPGGLSPQGLAEYLVYCYVPGDATLDRGVRQVPPGSFVVIDPEGGIVERRRWYHLSFARTEPRAEAEIAREYRDLLERAVVRRMADGSLGAFLSGGMDSSSIVTFASRHREEPVLTYSYRCAGRSFDESFYARSLALALGTRHTEVEYGEDRTELIREAVHEMDLPFSDIGLEIGTWLLGSAARRRVEVLFTGDGGDELWASHPVYAAQRLIRWYDRLPVPGVARRGLARLARSLPDSDRKRDLRVKIRRLLPPDGLPPSLGPFRWRAYYSAKALASVLTPETGRLVSEADPFRCVLEGYEGYDGPDDGVSPHLYNDYRTSSGYYFQRLRLLAHFGIEVRCPFYDRSLVEFGAAIPASRKLEGVERTKRLFRVAMEGILPDVINHRRDKLGHSIPFKNWLRRSGPLASLVGETLSREVVRSRGLFRPEVVSRMLEEHRTCRDNHSQRLWAMVVLELWLRAREGRALLAQQVGGVGA